MFGLILISLIYSNSAFFFGESSSCGQSSPCLPVLQLPQRQPSCSPPCSPPQQVRYVALETPCSPCNPSDSYSPRLSQPCSPCDTGNNRDMTFLTPTYGASPRDASGPRFIQGPIYQISPQIVPVPFYVPMLPPIRKSSYPSYTPESEYTSVDPPGSPPSEVEYASAITPPPAPSPYDFYAAKTGGESVATFENTRYAPQHKIGYLIDTEPYKFSGSAIIADKMYFRSKLKAALKKSSYEVGKSFNQLPPPPPPSPDQSLSESYANFGNGPTSYTKRESTANFIDTDESQTSYQKKYPNTFAKFEYAK